MRNPQGYATISMPEGQVTELDTFTCGHCNRIHHVRPKERPEDLGGLCKQCMALICPDCVGKGCTPLEQAIEAMEARDRLVEACRV